MRFMYIVTSERPAVPTPALMEAMGKLADREIKAGRMIDSGGLMPRAMGAQVRIRDGELSVIDGPFVEAKEVIGGYAIFELRNKEEALASAVEFMQLHKQHMPGWEGTCELRAFATPQLIGGGRVNMISNLVYQLGFASFNFPFAASLCVAGLALTIVVLSALRLAARPLENIRPH